MTEQSKYHRLAKQEKHQWNNETTKQRQEILPTGNTERRNIEQITTEFKSRKLLARLIFMEKLSLVRREFPCCKFA